MDKRTESDIQTGDHFMKVSESYGKVWTVVELKVASDSILHARLKASGAQNGTATIAANVLADRHFWTPVDIK